MASRGARTCTGMEISTSFQGLWAYKGLGFRVFGFRVLGFRVWGLGLYFLRKLRGVRGKGEGGGGNRGLYFLKHASLDPY